MRAIAMMFACVAACGGGGGNTDGGDDAPPGDGGDGDGPPPETPLTERLVVSTVATPAGAMAGDSNWRIWGRASLRVAPVFTVPLADCGTLVGYTTGTSAPTARVARLDAADKLVTTFDLGAFELRGLAAEPDGHFAALVWDQTPDPPVLHVKRYDKAGVAGTSTSLADTLAAPTDFGIGESRLEYGGGKYGAYFHVHGISDFANGHEGDALHWVDAASGAKTTGWQWGCSHSMSELLRYNGAAFLSACVTDCFPGTSGDFATQSIGGIYLDKSKKVIDVDAACNGSVAGELGGLTHASTGWRLVFNAHQNPATKGQSSYSSSTMNQDIGFAVITNAGATSSVVWLTTTPGNEANASIARWQPFGDDTEQFVVGWSAGTTYKLARVAPNGDVLAAPVDITAAKWGERDDPFRVHANGDVVWSWFDAAGATSFSIARLKSGRTATCAQL